MKKIPALIVTFKPSDDFFSGLDALLSQFDQILVVDNGSGGDFCRMLEEKAQKASGKLLMIFNERNLGIAAALNQGFQWADQRGFSHMIALDQDSIPAPDMVQELMLAYHNHPEREKVAILAPQVIDAETGERIPYLRERGILHIERTLCRGDLLEDVMLVITSGALYDLAAYKAIGGYREEYFIDYVDTEYCLALRQHGYRISVACKAVLKHRLGDQKRKRISSIVMRPTFHSPLRWYYINRNRMDMYGRYALRKPSWAAYDFLMGVYAFLKMLVFEDRKLRKITAVALGVFDGIFHRMGPVSASRMRLLEK